MKILLVHAHSEADSFVSAMRDTIVASFRERGDSVTVSDLYAMEFNPVSGPEDFGERSDPGHLTYALEQRHGYEQGTIAQDIKDEIGKVLEADVVGFTFPLYWFGTPAILKGWIDRVFISGTFYGGKRLYANGGMAGKKAFAAFSLGGREHMFGDNSLHGPLTTGMMKHFFQGTLGYAGFSVVEPFIAHHVPYLPLDVRQKCLAELREYVLAFDGHVTMPMPDLRDFGPRFEPLQKKPA